MYCTYREREVQTSKNVNHDPGSIIDIKTLRLSFTEISKRGMWFLASAAASFLYLALPPLPPFLLTLNACPEETGLANRSGSNYLQQENEISTLANIRSPFHLHHFLPFNVSDTKASFAFSFFPSLTLLSLHFFLARNVRPWKCPLWPTLRVFRNVLHCYKHPAAATLCSLFAKFHLLFYSLFLME